jgi:hypothetical protein
VRRAQSVDVGSRGERRALTGERRRATFHDAGSENFAGEGSGAGIRQSLRDSHLTIPIQGKRTSAPLRSLSSHRIM